MTSCLRVGALIAVCLLIPAGVNSQAVVSIETVDAVLSDTIVNPCTGGGLALAGVIRFRVMTTFNAGGGMDVVIHTNNQGASGVADDGTVYRFVGTSNLSIHVPDLNAAGQVFSLLSTSQLVGQGTAPDAYFIQHDHVTMLPDFRVTVQHDSFEGICRQ